MRFTKIAAIFAAHNCHSLARGNTRMVRAVWSESRSVGDISKGIAARTLSYQGI